MDAIKKKMQAMKLEKDNAMDRADACEQQAKDANLRAERVNQKKLLSIEDNSSVQMASNLVHTMRLLFRMLLRLLSITLVQIGVNIQVS